MDIERLAAAFRAVDGLTMTLLIAMCTIAGMKVRAQMANVALMAVVFPAMIGLCIATYTLFLAAEMFNPKKMAEWMIYVVASGTIGSCTTVLVMAALSRLWERSANA